MGWHVSPASLVLKCLESDNSWRRQKQHKGQKKDSTNLSVSVWIPSWCEIQMSPALHVSTRPTYSNRMSMKKNRTTCWFFKSIFSVENKSYFSVFSHCRLQPFPVNRDDFANRSLLASVCPAMATWTPCTSLGKVHDSYPRDQLSQYIYIHIWIIHTHLHPFQFTEWKNKCINPMGGVRNACFRAGPVHQAQQEVPDIDAAWLASEAYSCQLRCLCQLTEKASRKLLRGTTYTTLAEAREACLRRSFVHTSWRKVVILAQFLLRNKSKKTVGNF